MHGMRTVNDVNLDDLIRLVARSIDVTQDEVVPFGDYSDFFVELLTMTYRPTAHLISAGHVTPEIEIAADRAEIKLTEVFGSSPFTADIDAVLQEIRSTSDIVYIANPNRVCGNNYSLADLRQLAQAVPRGYLIVDEYYLEYYGISALPLLDALTNVIVVRSFTGSFGIMSIDAGYAVANRATADQIRDSLEQHRISTTVRKTILAALLNSDAMGARLKEVHEESLRLCQALTKLGVQTRITSTDFILIRVADPRRVGNALAQARIPIDNLDGYRGLNNFMRYRVQSPLSNDKVIEAFSGMPDDLYRMTNVDSRSITLRRPKEEVATEAPTTDIESDDVVERQTVYEAVQRAHG